MSDKEVGVVALPLDSCGKAIHIGDEVCCPRNGTRGKVLAINLYITDAMAVNEITYGNWSRKERAACLCHYHESPTAQAVRRLVDDVMGAVNRYIGSDETHDDYDKRIDDIVAEYAEKLQLKEGS